ncbi:MAG: hypothetical protein ABJB66_15740 [Gemmatimonadaceae bacterium]
MIGKVLRAGLLSFFSAAPLLGQLRPTPPIVFHVERGLGLTSKPSQFRFGTTDEKKNQRAPLLAPLASLVVPGSGQVLMRQQRAVGYLAAEVFLWLQAINARKDINRGRSDFRQLAADVARANFGATRPPGNWDYYETLEDKDASGYFDLGIGGKFTPETDESTYNGQRWLQARETYWADPNVVPAENSPQYQQALAFYQARAVSGSYRWSWIDHQLEKDSYKQFIKDANASRQRYVSNIGLIAANHLVSMVDAYISVRLRRYGGAGLGARVEVETRSIGDPRYGNFGSALKVSLPLPRAFP